MDVAQIPCDSFVKCAKCFKTAEWFERKLNNICSKGSEISSWK